VITIYSGTRTNLVPGKETYTSSHKGTRAYLESIRCDDIAPGSAEQVDDSSCDPNGRHIKDDMQAHA
jgi:hypothetical protein